MDFSERFSTRIPSALGLPAPLLADGSPSPNLAEGVVVRPVLEPPACARPRGMVKRKIREFAEKCYRYDDWREALHLRSGDADTVRRDKSDATLLRYEMR